MGSLVGRGRAAAGRLMEVVVTSVESVKPRAVVDQFRTMQQPFKLSLLDQLMSPHYTSMVFFYPAAAKHGHNKTTDHHYVSAAADELKASLSKALNPFYPLAGRVRDNLVIDDFHAGVPFFEARARGLTLSEFLSPPKLDLLSDLVALEPFRLLTTDQVNGGDDVPQLAVKMNTFECGGVAIGLNFYHKIADVGTIVAFLDAWAAIAKSDSSSSFSSARDTNKQRPAIIMPPDLTSAASVFPPQPSIPPSMVSPTDELFFQNHRRTATRRFVFQKEAVAALKHRARSSHVESPSRTEALSAFVWESALRAAPDDHDRDQLLQCFGQPINLRNRMGDRLSPHCIGNVLTLPFAFRGQRETMDELAAVIRQATAGVDESFLNSISGEQGFRTRVEGQKWWVGKISSGRQFMTSSSLLSFDLDGFELGRLGKPAWVGMLGEARGDEPCVENLMILKELAGPVHSGMVEASMRLDEDVMAGLESDPQFLEFASPNPPLILH